MIVDDVGDYDAVTEVAVVVNVFPVQPVMAEDVMDNCDVVVEAAVVQRYVCLVGQVGEAVGAVANYDEWAYVYLVHLDAFHWAWMVVVVDAKEYCDDGIDSVGERPVSLVAN